MIYDSAAYRADTTLGLSEFTFVMLGIWYRITGLPVGYEGFVAPRPKVPSDRESDPHAR